MAGAGIKLFVAGEVAYAAEVNQYLMDQAIAKFADVAERTAAYGDGIALSLGGDGKPELSEGMFSYLVDRGDGQGEVQFYNGASWVGASNFAVADGSINTVKLADDAVTSDKIADNAITSAHIAAGTVIAADIADNTITEAKLTTSVAGNGLAGGNGSALSVNVDGSTIEINSDSLRIKDAGVTASKIATAVAGNGLSGGGGSALAVNVDDSTIEISSDSLRLKDAGITSAKMGANISLTGTTEIEEVLEAVVINATALTGTVNIDAKSGAVHYFTSNSAANWVWNFRGDGSTTLNSIIDVGQSVTFALFATNSTAYKPTSLTVDTTGTVSVKWFGGNSYPSGNASSIDCYTITIIKTAANTYTAFASQSKFA